MARERTIRMDALLGEPRNSFTFPKHHVFSNTPSCCVHVGQFFEQLARRMFGGEHTSTDWAGGDRQVDVEVADLSLGIEVKAAGSRYFKVHKDQLSDYAKLCTGFPFDMFWYVFFRHSVSGMNGMSVEYLNKLLAKTTTQVSVLDMGAMQHLSNMEDQFPHKDYSYVGYGNLLVVNQKPLWKALTNGLLDVCGPSFEYFNSAVKLRYCNLPFSMELRAVMSSEQKVILKRLLKDRTEVEPVRS